ncbi:hypothetical protein N7510_009187 [Penicillium lagena]|uniref:uncharacterized protein n=1 Tax=Penicillium lagena TaxID=94218 RepID=UPI0025411027|nr:uncharacterized protein N7510_009187 [Penicillium lagena]KAJ5606406.1 hypothetical protein N7510_009187 [Penicillium lagena]
MAGPQTPVQDYLPHESVRGFSRSSRPSSYVGSNSMPDQPQMAHNPRFREDFDAASRRSSLMLDGAGMQRSASQMSRARSPHPEKEALPEPQGSLRRNGSRRSMRAGSVRSLSLGDREKYSDGTEDANSAFTIPIPTTGNPTEVLSNRFQAWRKVLKDLILFFKEVQKSYETRSKLFLSASHVIGNQAIPPAFLQSGGLADATEILRDFHRQGYTEANKAVEVEMEVISQLTGLRSDLQKKTKEIKNLAGDFKNSVEKELDGTRKSVRNLQEALGLVDTDPSATAGKGDPFILRLSVERQVEKQIEEENYLHRAYLNLENSGRELESIVVSEIQKAYNAYASILRREADETYDTIEKLRVGPISIPQDYEWNSFVAGTDELVDPRIPLRHLENIVYPGRDHPAAAEVRAGMLERKSKYLKSYTPGWYVLSPTHLHEFKSADRVAWQTPVMSLYLPEQKLSSHSQPDSSSHKFMLKGRQTGAMHRGHSWVFRAESHETMMSWYEDIESLINKTGEARNAFVRRHVRSVSGMSYSSDGAMEEDEADRTPYSGSMVLAGERPTSAPRQPGGAFPSDVQIDRHMQAPLSPSSGDGSVDKEVLAAAGGMPDGSAAPASSSSQRGFEPNTVDGVAPASHGGESSRARVERHDSYYGDWIGPAAIAAKQRKYNPTDSTVDDREVRSDGDHTPLVAAGMVDRSGRRENSAPPQARRESVSTVPTNTNVTDYTNNTMATSVDEESSLAQKSPGMGDGALPFRPKTDSMATMDMKIPGRYPPTNVAA